MIPPGWNIAVGLLPVTTQINAQNAALGVIGNETSNTIGVILLVDETRPRTTTFRKDQQELIRLDEDIALFQGPFHFVPISSPTNGEAFREVAYNGQKQILLKICPFRQVPGHPVVTTEMVGQGQEPVGQKQGINHRQMIGTDQPRPSMFL